MKIIILGAGHTGSSIAHNLTKEGNDVVVVDINPGRLRELQDSVDIATITGAGTYPDSLQRANTEDADIVIAVLPRDEDNITACQVAWTLYHPPLIIARIRNIHYLNHPELFTKDNIPIDKMISPESLVTRYVQNLIEYPGIRQLHDFNNGNLKLVSLNVQAQSKAINMNIKTLFELSPGLHWLGRVAEGKVTPIDRTHYQDFDQSTTFLDAGDRVLFVTTAQTLAENIALFQAEIKPYKRIIIAGGGHVGKRLAISLQEHFNVKIIEKKSDRARNIAEYLDKTMVLSGDATDPYLLTNEGISDSDVFCALTSSDEANILSSMMAKKLGVKETICLVNKAAYIDMILSSAIDTVFSPEKITAAHILRHVRKGGIVNVCPLHGSTIDVIEIVVEGSQETSRAVGLKIPQLDLPEDVIICAIIRRDQLLNLNSELTIETRDQLILVVPIKKMSIIEKYFQVIV